LAFGLYLKCGVSIVVCLCLNCNALILKVKESQAETLKTYPLVHG
jgi:hypothetical protein